MEKLASKLRSIDFRPTGLVEKLSETLTEAILEGIFKEGDQLIEVDLQKQFGISRTPIRESFRVLEKKGLVEVVPRKGTFVKRIFPRDIEEHFPVRSVLEGLAAKQAYPNMNASTLEMMERALARMKVAAENGDAKNYWKQHILFHEIFIDSSGNRLLINLVKILRMQIMWYRLSYQYYQEDFKKSYRTHEEILGLFKNKNTDPAKLEAVVRNHIDEAVNKFMGYLDAQEKIEGPAEPVPFKRVRRMPIKKKFS
ncbi:MAG: GntR family transcriptional regulator [Deltaproteobacteria bacterium]|nr:GntR family transcriptional regulator [Deltaproteobacteria bacterium]